MATKNKYLFAIDLDGTLLRNSRTSEIHPEDRKAIQLLRDAGHIVCIVTGRPWNGSSKAYHSLELDTIIGNFNGAHIHNPSDYNFQHYTEFMNLNDVMYIIGDKHIQDVITNLAIEGPGWVMLDKKSKELEEVFGFNTTPNLKLGINVHKIPLKPTGVVFDTKKGVNVLKLKDYLQRTYGDLVEISSWSKGEGLTPVFDMTAVGVNKARAISLMARYYDVPIKHTVAIGDGYNDVPMFEVAEFSVAVGNASEDIKSMATYSTKKTNKDGAVAEFVKQFLDKESGKNFRRQLRSDRRKMKNIKDDTVKAH